eukprot:8830104-Alexandrium_andersonii.AAC.1
MGHLRDLGLLGVVQVLQADHKARVHAHGLLPRDPPALAVGHGLVLAVLVADLAEGLVEVVAAHAAQE